MPTLHFFESKSEGICVNVNVEPAEPAMTIDECEDWLYAMLQEVKTRKGEGWKPK
jgi:hypothetical protein